MRNVLESHRVCYCGVTLKKWIENKMEFRLKILFTKVMVPIIAHLYSFPGNRYVYKIASHFI